MENNEAFAKKLLETYRIEAEDHIKVLTEGLLAMENGVGTEEEGSVIESVYRATHSLKGASRAVNLPEVEHLCQAMETIFASLKTKFVTPSQALYDELHSMVDAITSHIFSESKEGIPELSALTERVDTVLKGGSVSPKRSSAAERKPDDSSPPIVNNRDSERVDYVSTKSSHANEKVSNRKVEHKAPQLITGVSDSVRVSMSKLETILYQAEEMIGLKHSLKERHREIRSVVDLVNDVRFQWPNMLRLLTKHGVFVKSGARRNGEITEYLDGLHASILAIDKKLCDIESYTSRDSHSTEMAVDALIDSVRNVVMLPFSSLLETFPKIVRDLARDKEINVEFHVSGADIEIDRRILDEMKDPFIHLIRNSIDHGIETPEIRASRKKSPAGSISISVNRIEGNKAEILFSDDGNGIDEEKVRLAARKAGHITASDEKEESNENFSTLLFLSGVSTSEFVTDLSGRGLGLAIVRENIEKLGGSVDVTDTRCGVGTTFRMVIPLTRATFRGIRIRVSENEFIVPVSAVEHVFSADEEDLFFVKGKRVINYGDISMQLISLGDIFMLPCKKDESTKINILVVSSGTLKVAMAVQEVMDEEEVLVRSMDVRLASVRYFNGAAVLGSGRVIPVIDVSAIIKTASAKKNIPVPQEIGPPTPADEQKSVLVVEDSITSRMLLKNILESAGFKVVTANDGIDGFSKLPGHSIDLVVSDVDMPRMNGFDLTAKIKTDKRYAEIPVVLVTALESSEDKKHGIDVGADAYIIKSSFDQSNLIEVIERLV